MGAILKDKVSVSEFANIIGISNTRVHTLISEGKLEKNDSKLNTENEIRRYCRHLREQAAGRSTADPDNPDKPKLDPVYEGARHKARQSDLLEMKIAQAQGRLLSMDDALEVLAMALTSAKSKLMALATALPTQIHGLSADDMQVIKDEVYDVLIELAEDAQGFEGQVKAKALEEE